MDARAHELERQRANSRRAREDAVRAAQAAEETAIRERNARRHHATTTAPRPPPAHRHHHNTHAPPPTNLPPGTVLGVPVDARYRAHPTYADEETALAAAKDVGLDPAKFAFDPLNPAATPKATDLTALGVSNAAEASGDGQQSSYVAAAEASDAGGGGRASWGATATSEGAEGARARGSLTREA